MRKLFQIVFASVLATMLLTAPVLAAAAAPMEIPVMARSDYKTAWVEVLVEEGQASAELENGIRVSVSGENLDGLTLVVYPIPRSDEQAWTWITSCMKNYGTNLFPIDLYFTDSQGSRVEVRSVFSVTVTGAGKYQTPAVFYLNEDGAVGRMESKTEGTAITFTTNHNSYYVLAESEEERTSADDQSSGNNTSRTDAGIPPETGDNGQPGVWCAFLLMSGSVFLFTLCNAEKNKKFG